MKSFCIKTNRIDVIDYLLTELEKIELQEIYYSKNKFKIYQNVIIHYKGQELEQFYKIIVNILKNVVQHFFEERFIKQVLNFNYFYFEDYEKKQIYEICMKSLIEENASNKMIEKELITYVKENKNMLLEGFVTFRLNEYMKFIDNQVDSAVNQYIIEKEYNEFISLLKVYIESKNAGCNLLHLIYYNGESILLDKNKNIVSISENILNTKYLSDISFSSNDFALNTLLTLLPEKIELHLIDEEDEFIHTLKSIFEGRISICKECNICKTYKLIELLGTEKKV